MKLGKYKQNINSLGTEIQSRLNSPLRRVSLLLVLAGCAILWVEFVLFRIDYSQYGFFWAMTGSHSTWFEGYKLWFRISLIIITVGLYLIAASYYYLRLQKNSEKWYDWIKTGEWPKD